MSHTRHTIFYITHTSVFSIYMFVSIMQSLLPSGCANFMKRKLNNVDYFIVLKRSKHTR